MVTMQRQRTIRATEMPLVKRHLNDSSASAAPLAASSGFGVLQQLATACYSFVFQHTVESSPSSIEYVFSEMMIMNHSFDVKIFTRDYTISQSEASAELV